MNSALDLEEKYKITQTLKDILYKYGVAALQHFETKFHHYCNYIVTVPYNHIPNDPKFIKTNFRLSTTIWNGKSYNDCYKFRVESPEKFWLDLEKYKRLLKLSAFS